MRRDGRDRAARVFIRAQEAAGGSLPLKGAVLFSVTDKEKPATKPVSLDELVAGVGKPPRNSSRTPKAARGSNAGLVLTVTGASRVRALSSARKGAVVAKDRRALSRAHRPYRSAVRTNRSRSAAAKGPRRNAGILALRMTRGKPWRPNLQPTGCAARDAGE